MAIERIDMAGGEGGGSPEGGGPPVEPTIVTPESRQGGQPAEPKFQTEGNFTNAIDSTTGEVIRRMPQLAGRQDQITPPNPGDEPDPEVLALVAELEHGEGDPHFQIPELTNEEVQIFISEGQTIEMLMDAKNHMNADTFKQIAKNKLRMIAERKESEKLTPKERKDKEEKDKEEKLKKLEKEFEAANALPTGTEKEQRLVKLLKRNLQKEIDHLNGRENEVLDPEDLEVEASNERGLEIAKRIIKYEALVKFGKKLTQEEWNKLNDAYLDQKIHIEARRWLQGKPNFSIEDNEGDKPPVFKDKVDTEGFGGDVYTLEQLYTLYNTGSLGSKDSPERAKFTKDLAIYFKEAKEIGLFKELDEVLKAGYMEAKSGINRGLKVSEIMSGTDRNAGIDRSFALAQQDIQEICADKQWTDDGISHLQFLAGNRLVGVWELYAKFARERLVSKVLNKDIDFENGREYIKDKDGKTVEFEFNDEEGEGEKKETYWRIVNGWYPEIYAKTEDEFRIAAESYISNAQDITAAPDKLLQDSTQFLDQIMKSDGSKSLSKEFKKNLYLEVKARIGAYGADHSNEQYHGDYVKQFMDFVNKDGEGPAAWLNLAKSMDGKIAAALWLMDSDPRWDIIFTMYGSRGQLADASHAQRTTQDGWGLHNQAIELLVEELVGVDLKDKSFAKNLTRPGSKQDFTKNFNGLYLYDGKDENAHKHGSAHLSVYEEYSHKKIKDGKIVDGETEGAEEIKHENQLPKNISQKLRDSFRIGRIQHQLERYKHQIAHNERPSNTYKVKGKDKTVYYDPAKNNLTELLSPGDKKFYEEKVSDAHKAVHIALEMYGVFGEKSKRGGGVFKTDERQDEEGKKYQDFIPTHEAEKFVQMAVTMTKIRYANKSAKFRTQKVNEAIKRASKELRENGRDAVLKDEDGNVVTIKRPKENPHKPGEVLRNAITDEVMTGEVDVDFYTAIHHQFANWTGHTYWSYQEEDRHLLLADTTFIEARDILNGKLRPEDASIWANQLIILDPTLRRVRRFVEKNFEDRERKLTMAAVEDSYQTHWQIARELHREFFPEFGTPAENIGMYYGLQDFGGYRKMLESVRVMAGQDPDRFMRRGRRLLPDLHIPISTYAEYLGRGTDGMMGVLQTMDAPVYRGAGSMALDKFSAQLEVAGKLFGTLFGTKGQEGYIEGLLLKLTNNSDKLRQIADKLPEGLKWASYQVQNNVSYAIIDSLGRLKEYLKWFPVMESDIRNATGAFDLRNIDILIDDDGNPNIEVMNMLDTTPESLNLSFADTTKNDLTQNDLRTIIKKREKELRETEGNYNEVFNEIGIDEQRSPNTGSGRHSARIFFDVFGSLLKGIVEKVLEEEYQGRKSEGLPLRDGPELYPGEALIYNHIYDKIIYLRNKNGNRGQREPYTSSETIWDFVFSKLVPT